MRLARFIRDSLVCAAAALALAVGPAQASYYSGSFSGIAQADALPLGFTPPRPESYYDNAPVTGTFEVYAPDPQFQSGGDGYAYFLNGGGGWLSLTYTIKDASFSYLVGTPDPSSGSLPSVILLQAATATNPNQSVRFLTDFMPRYEGASFGLSGPAGSLFDGLDASTLHFDPANPPLFSTDFASSAAAMHVAVDIDRVSFQNVAAIPEPATATLFLLGCALLAWQIRLARTKTCKALTVRV